DFLCYDTPKPMSPGESHGGVRDTSGLGLVLARGSRGGDFSTVIFKCHATGHAVSSARVGATASKRRPLTALFASSSSPRTLPRAVRDDRCLSSEHELRGVARTARASTTQTRGGGGDGYNAPAEPPREGA